MKNINNDSISEEQTQENIDFPRNSSEPKREEEETDSTKMVFTYDIPIQSKEDCEKQNKTCRNMFGKNFTPLKSTEEHVESLIEQLYNAIEKVGDAGGWYVGDGIKVKIELVYDPENK